MGPMTPILSDCREGATGGLKSTKFIWVTESQRERTKLTQKHNLCESSGQGKVLTRY